MFKFVRWEYKEKSQRLTIESLHHPLPAGVLAPRATLCNLRRPGDFESCLQRQDDVVHLCNIREEDGIVVRRAAVAEEVGPVPFVVEAGKGHYKKFAILRPFILVTEWSWFFDHTSVLEFSMHQ